MRGVIHLATLGGAVVFLLVFSAFAGDAGNESPFLTGAGARALGLGGGFTSVADDATAVFYNPAGLSHLQSQEASFMQMTLFEGASYGSAFWAYPILDFGGVGVGLMRLGTGEILRRSDYVARGEFSYSYTQALFAVGHTVRDVISVGLSGKIVSQSLDTHSDYGMGVDLGLFAPLYRRFQLGLILRDAIRPELKLDQTSESVPTSIAGGLAVKNTKITDRLRVTASFELEKVGRRSTKVHAGGEAIFDDKYAIRSGYDRDNFSFGIGGRFNRIGVDYTYKLFDNIENSHRFSLSILLGKPVEEQLEIRRRENEKLGAELLREERQRQFEFHRAAAEKYYAEQHLDSALFSYQRAQAFDGDDADIMAAIAELQDVRDTQRRELARVEKEQENSQRNVGGFLIQARAFLQTGQYHASRDMLDLIFDVDTRNAEALRLQDSLDVAVRQDILDNLNSARHADSVGALARALEAYDRILELDPDNEIAQAREDIAGRLDVAEQLAVAIEKFDRKRYRQARRALLAVLATDREHPVALDYLHKVDSALVAPPSIEQIADDDVVWQLYLDGLRYMRNGHYKAAIETWEKVLDAYPGNLNTLENIKQARLRLESEQNQ